MGGFLERCCVLREVPFPPASVLRHLFCGRAAAAQTSVAYLLINLLLQHHRAGATPTIVALT